MTVARLPLVPLADFPAPLDEAMRRLSGEEEAEMVDRRLVTKLLVTYFSRGNSAEVLELMSRMLNFDDADKRACGLAGGGSSSFFSSLWSNNGDGSESQRGDGAEKDGFADIWLDFMEREATGD